MANAVELYDVSKTFGTTVAVDSLSVTVPEGSIYGFIGPNGSGKTTTLRLMLRIYQPDAGRVVVLGVDRVPVGVELPAVRVHAGLQVRGGNGGHFIRIACAMRGAGQCAPQGKQHGKQHEQQDAKAHHDAQLSTGR